MVSVVNEPQAALLGVHFKGFNFKSRYIVEVKQGQKEEGKIGQAPEADSLNKKVWAQTELWGKSVPDLKIAFFKKSLVLAGTKLSMGLA